MSILEGFKGDIFGLIIALPFCQIGLDLTSNLNYKLYLYEFDFFKAPFRN